MSPNRPGAADYEDPVVEEWEAIGVVLHKLTFERRIWVEAHRARCTCGWEDVWYVSRTLAERAARRHYEETTNGETASVCEFCGGEAPEDQFHPYWHDDGSPMRSCDGCLSAPHSDRGGAS